MMSKHVQHHEFRHHRIAVRIPRPYDWHVGRKIRIRKQEILARENRSDESQARKARKLTVRKRSDHRELYGASIANVRPASHFGAMECPAEGSEPDLRGLINWREQ